MLLRSLRLRILGAVALVLIVAIATVEVTAQQVTTRGFVSYVGNVNKQEQLTLSKVMTMYRQSADPAAVQQVIDRLAAADGRRIVFIGLDHRVIADSAHQLVGQLLNCAPPPPGLSDCLGAAPGDTAASALVISAAPPGPDVAHAVPAKALPPNPVWLFTGHVSSAAVPSKASVDGAGQLMLSPAIIDESHFVNTTSRSLALAAIVGGLLALLLALVLSARILRPVQALTAAAREMARGDLAQRVPVRGHDELGVLAHAFNAMADSVARAERLRRTMLGDVAHDLRTPLTSIDGYLEAIEDGLVRPTPEVISGLRGDVVLLKRLVEDLQELAQAEAGQLHFDSRPLDLAAILQQAAAALLPQARAKGVQLEVAAPAALPLALADAQRVGQVVRNLLQNAITATPAGGRVTVGADGDPLEVYVADTGIGIPPEHVPNVFERFYRVDPARNRTTGGSGLGLAIVKQLVEQQGGRVTVESRVGEGSVFRFALPPAPADVAADETALPSPVHSGS